MRSVRLPDNRLGVPIRSGRSVTGALKSNRSVRQSIGRDEPLWR